MANARWPLFFQDNSVEAIGNAHALRCKFPQPRSPRPFRLRQGTPASPVNEAADIISGTQDKEDRDDDESADAHEQQGHRQAWVIGFYGQSGDIVHAIFSSIHLRRLYYRHCKDGAPCQEVGAP